MIKRVLFSALALASPLAFSSPAQASSDSSCYPDWKVRQTVMNGCSGTALLSPGNDTRINLLMLLSDRHGDVGISNTPDYSEEYRRGDAEPFDYPLFAAMLGRKPPKDSGDDNDFYGSRCISNGQGAAEFEAALATAKGLSVDDRAKLSEARKSLRPECADGSDTVSAVATLAGSMKSQVGKGFANYLLAAASFYDGDFASARGRFQELANGPAGWTKEAATYMLGRVELNHAMEGAFDDYGYPAESPTNQRELEAAERALKSYLQAHPQGRYAASARGLLRKVYWLGGETEKLTAEYSAAFARKNRDGLSVSLADLVQELDIKALDKLDIDKVKDPYLLAMLDLRAMRYSEDPEYQSEDDKPISRAALEGQRSRFAGQEALFNYLLAAHSYYVAKDAAAALQLLPANAAGAGYLAYSQRALRAVALDAKGDPGARAALAAQIEAAQKPFQRGTMELALAMHDERHAGLERVFAANSPVRDPQVREILLRYSAGPKLLRTQAAAKEAAKQEREVATYTLLYKELTRGAYKDFLADLALIPAGTGPKPEDDYTAPLYTNIAIFKWPGTREGFACPSLKTLATALASAPKDAPSLLCVAEFARLNGLDTGGGWPWGIPEALDTLPPKDQLGGTPSLFPGKPFSRLELYKGVIADPAATAPNKAYALYRAVYCYGPSGYNSCGGTEVPVATRKAWFNQLKKNYPTSPWATKLKYYW